MKTKTLIGLILLSILTGCSSNSSNNNKQDIYNKKLVLIIPADKRGVVADINISREGKLSGFGGCNRLMGEVEVRDNTIRFNKVASTRMYCNGIMDLEEEFLKGLYKAHYYEILDNRVMLKDKDANPVLFFEIID